MYSVVNTNFAMINFLVNIKHYTTAYILNYFKSFSLRNKVEQITLMMAYNEPCYISMKYL